jgi:hypothetical protein
VNGGFFLFLKVGEGLDELSMDDVVEMQQLQPIKALLRYDVA